MDFRRYEAWTLAYAATRSIYELTGAFPRQEEYGLKSQLRRAAVSAVSNIAEGAGRGSDKDFARFLQMAVGSLNEVETQLLLSEDLGLLPGGSTQACVLLVRRSRGVTVRLRDSLRRS